jgi:hypothetical protein
VERRANRHAEANRYIFVAIAQQMKDCCSEATDKTRNYVIRKCYLQLSEAYKLTIALVSDSSSLEKICEMNG